MHKFVLLSKVDQFTPPGALQPQNPAGGRPRTTSMGFSSFPWKDTIEEFNVDSKAGYSALSSTRSRKNIKMKKLKQTNASVPLIQYRFRSVKAVRKEIRVTMEERMCETDAF